MKMEPITLATLGEGAAVEMFERELSRVLEDIDDSNTKPDTKRVIVLEVTFSPSEGRDYAALEIKCKSKLAGLKPADAIVHLASHGNRLVALAKNPGQLDAFQAVSGGKDAE